MCNLYKKLPFKTFLLPFKTNPLSKKNWCGMFGIRRPKKAGFPVKKEWSQGPYKGGPGGRWGGEVDNNEGIIRASCSRYACRICRTKTNWPHQSWCDIKDVTSPACNDCCYYDRSKNACAHPALGKPKRKYKMNLP